MEIRSSPPSFDIPRYLSTLPQFSELDAADQQRLAKGCSLRRLQRGDMVQHAGAPCEAFHITVVGQIKLFALSAEGKEKVVEIVGPSGSFGEAPMFLDQPCLLSALALTDVLLLDVNRRILLDEIERNPSIAMCMLAGLSRRLHGMVRDVQSYALHSGLHRVIGYLLRESDGLATQAFTLSLPVSKATVASRLSLTPEYFSRVLHELETARLIAIDRRDIHVLDLARLAAYSPP
ncbi:MAG: Crp/Fnr family transcriptional regulator [Comamonadaceae bacterium]|nr:Crp/Fnr family transcriptional regulator [Comamonadaceae bacterium]